MFCNRFLRRFLDTVQKSHKVSISVVTQTALEKIPLEQQSGHSRMGQNVTMAAASLLGGPVVS